MSTSLRLRIGDALWKNALRPYLFSKKPENAHLFSGHVLMWAEQHQLLWLLKLLYCSPHYMMPTHVFGGDWRNPVGLATGFDKDGLFIPAFDALGFGSIEVGTIVPRPQLGNPRPRVFRSVEHRAILNRYGFNSLGARNVTERIRRAHLYHPDLFPIGVSIGKNKDTPDDRAVGDYIEVYRWIRRVLRPRDWVQINISSPNTPGLRGIFDRLDEFLGEFIEATRILPLTSPQMEGQPQVARFVLKVPPDGLTCKELESVVELSSKYGFSGVEATNTTVDEEIKKMCGFGGESGGVSGAPLRALATQKLLEMKYVAQEKHMDLVGVGGIETAEDALEKRMHGAKAVQCYSGLVFSGPILPHNILQAWR